MILETIVHCKTLISTWVKELPFAVQVWSAAVSLRKCQASFVPVWPDKQLQKDKKQEAF